MRNKNRAEPTQIFYRFEPGQREMERWVILTWHSTLIPAMCFVSSVPRFGVDVGVFVTLGVRVRQTPLAGQVSDVGKRSQPELWRGETCRHATLQR